MFARVRVEYWPYLGAGVWGQRVLLQNAPRLPRNWKPERLFLSDINGRRSSKKILVYVDYVGCVYYAINRQGHSFSEVHRIDFTPWSAVAQMADMAGNGQAGILWSYTEQPGRRYPDYRYLDFEGDKGRPYLMSKIDNHLGLITEISYASSTESYIKALEERRAWTTFLPIGIITIVLELSPVMW